LWTLKIHTDARRQGQIRRFFEEDLSECGLDIRDVLKHWVRHALPL
jgi:hypothetical protein